MALCCFCSLVPISVPLTWLYLLSRFCLQRRFHHGADFLRLCNGSLSWTIKSRRSLVSKSASWRPFRISLSPVLWWGAPTQVFHWPSAHLFVCLLDSVLKCQLMPLAVPKYLTSYTSEHGPLALLSFLRAVVLSHVILRQQHSACSEPVAMPTPGPTLDQLNQKLGVGPAIWVILMWEFENHCLIGADPRHALHFYTVKV